MNDRVAVTVIGTNLVMDYGTKERAVAAMEALRPEPPDCEACGGTGGARPNGPNGEWWPCGPCALRAALAQEGETP